MVNMHALTRLTEASEPSGLLVVARPRDRGPAERGHRPAALHRRPGTVKVHLSHIFTKLGITTRAELAAQAASRT
jgi:Bacterial regulatory proteins, luxR family